MCRRGHGRRGATAVGVRIHPLKDDHHGRHHDQTRSCRTEGARPYVEPLARELESPITDALDASVPGELEALFDRIRAGWGKQDILVYSIAFAPKEDLQGGLLNCSADGFAQAMDISCHSLIRMAKLAAPLMIDGGLCSR
jgi:enoyl-[acyl-carrier-protein] reductase (NADH)